jgi:hypothetical protein
MRNFLSILIFLSFVFYTMNVYAQQSGGDTLIGGALPDGMTNPKKERVVSSSGSIVRGGAPINLRPGAFMAHDKPVDDAVKMTKQKTTSAAVHNQNLLKARARDAAAARKKSPFPPGWGE